MMKDELNANEYLDMAFSDLPYSLQQTFKNVDRYLWSSMDGFVEVVEAWIKHGRVELTQNQVLGLE